MKALLVLAALFAYAAADCYMHNPRGCNDRNNEANTNRNNANRLFDSQNNAKGGYCYGPAMSFYEGSLLTVQWTNQHGCGQNPKLYCNLVLQYLCGPKDAPPTERVRDGTTTDTIPDTAAGPTAVDGNGELLYGMHESFQYYQDCKVRNRNLGLWISDREEEGGLTPQGRPSAIFTRQNNNGNRHGYECVEERDYYPYWHPSPWRDVAILTHNEEFCDFYQSNSQNVLAKGFCADKTSGKMIAPNNPGDCAVAGGVWTETAAWNIPAPDCVQAPWSRDNHLGSGQDGYENSYNWTLPDHSMESCISADNCNCVLRIRYNISTDDMGPDGNRPDAGFIDKSFNAEASPVKNDEFVAQDGAIHALALDTTQFGRTFQDRSFVFHIRPRPDGVSNVARIFNLNVRGKRGNIVQTYPATEYDFVPEALFGRVGDYIHFQWTGCDTNPAGNAGEGTDQTDRSNCVQIETKGASKPASDEWIETVGPALFEDRRLRLRMAMLDQTDCLTYEELLTKNGGNAGNAEADVQNCMKLNAAPQYFDGGLVRMNLTGEFYYMSSRNNNFSNRGQKGAIHIVPLLPVWAIVLVAVGGALFLLSAVVAVGMLYAKSHPHSGVAAMFSKI
jgi:hypothetical protein